MAKGYFMISIQLTRVIQFAWLVQTENNPNSYSKMSSTSLNVYLLS